MTMTQQHIVVTNNRRRNDVVVSGDTVDDLAPLVQVRVFSRGCAPAADGSAVAP
jgi:hypothetical protein